ncbi:MAG: hypothetical protein IKC38_07255 [Clostridia bacterium]|nr:hypothetical protein [Clostridia bacterium]
MELYQIFLFLLLTALGLYLLAMFFRDRYTNRVRLNGGRIRAVGRRLFSIFMPDEAGKERMQLQLQRLNMQMTAEEYCSAVITKVVLIGAAALAITLLSPVFGCLGLVVAILVWYDDMDRLPAAIRRKNDKLLAELPRFIRTFAYGMQYEKDILGMLETYCDVAGEGLKSDLVSLVNNMHSGNYEESLRQFDRSVSIPQLSRFVSALISIHKGEDQTTVLLDITQEITAGERERLRSKMADIPDKIQALSVPIVIGILAMYLFVIGHSFINSMNIIF